MADLVFGVHAHHAIMVGRVTGVCPDTSACLDQAGNRPPIRRYRTLLQLIAEHPGPVCGAPASAAAIQAARGMRLPTVGKPIPIVTIKLYSRL